MDLSTAFLGSINVNTDMLSSGQGLTKAEPAKTSGQRFESYYDSYRNNKPDTAQANRSRPERGGNDKPARRQDVADSNTPQYKQNVTNGNDKNVSESNVNKTKETKAVNEKPETSKKAETKTVDDTEKLVLEENIMAEVAAALGISQEDLELIMQELNIQPAQLTQNEEVIKLVQEYLQIEEPVQMLTASNFTDIVSTVGKAVDEAVQKTEATILDEQNILLQQKPNNDQSNKSKSTDETTVEAEEDVAEVLVKKTSDTADDSVEAEDVNSGSEKIVTDSSGTSNQQNSENMFNSNASNTGANMQPQQTTDSNLSQNNASVSFANVSQQASQAREVSTPSRSEAAQRMETVIQQIADKMKVDIRFDSKEMNLVLKPESLGSITLKLVTENGGVTAQFIAESQRAKEIIEANMSQLKDSLQQQGININQLSVEVGSDQNEQMQRFLNEQAKSGRRIHQLLQREGFGEEVAADVEQNTPASLDQSVGNSVNYKA